MFVFGDKFYAKGFCLNECRVPREARRGFDHLFPLRKGGSGSLGDILLVDELAIVVAAGVAFTGIGGTNAVRWR